MKTVSKRSVSGDTDEGGGARFRQLSGYAGLYGDIVLALIPVVGIVGILNLPSYFRIPLYLQQYIGCIYGLVIGAAFILIPIRKQSALDRLPWYDFVCSIVAIITGLYVAVYYRTIAIDIGLIQTERVILGAAAVLLTLEASRRTVGLPFAVIVIVFLAYALLSPFMPGIFRTKGVSYDMLATYLYLDPQGILGTPLEVATTIVLVFILFGQTITRVGVSRLFNDVAFSLMGRFRGGPAKVAVLASSLFGMISGSAVANVVTTGVFTIPLMKKAGYKPYFAGAVEAVASTGGQIMPPIMGAAAFLMATFLGIPYGKVALAAMIPAFLYYLAVFIQVDLRAAKENLSGIPKAELPRFFLVVKESWYLAIPLIVLVYALFFAWMEAETAGLIGVLSALILGFLNRQLRLRTIFTLLRDCGKGLLEVGVTSAGAGIIIGILTITGLAFLFSSILIGLANGNVFLLLLMSAIVASILGMGMTVTAAYLLTVAIGVPALIEVGIPPLLAHFFIFYFAVLSFLTPPVCLAAYAAASIAGANMMKTAFQAMRLGIAAYVVPFIFAYKPALLLQGSAMDIGEACVTAVLGVTLLAMGLEGFLFTPLVWWKRIVLMIGGVVLMIPGLLFDAIGIVIVAPVIIIEVRDRLARKRALKITPAVTV
ncbi:MAG: TRAP transporter fused permease subunit [Deltaproteobacteria bacterium]|nr:MAG: TRAP transporter fused permease subunit [Deltaproteobacteria bacterium]